MENNRKQALTKARFELSTKLQNVSEICEYLWSHGVLTYALIEEVLNKGTNSQKNTELMKILSTCDNSAYDAFRRALIETNAQKFLIEELPNFSAEEHQNAPANQDDVERAGSVDSYDISFLDDDLLKKLDAIQIDSTYSRKDSHQDLNAYPINPERPGFALVINNVNFDHMRERQGSDVDEHNIKLLLRAYNFEIFEEGKTRDLNMIRMTDVIERFSQLREHQKCSCSVVVVLTHGQDGYLFATDSYRNNLVSVKWMLELFQGNNCPNLNGKPKLFFLQACRGELMDKGADLYRHDSTDASLPTNKGDMKSADEMLCDKLLAQNYDEVDGITRRDVVGSRDIFIAYSTVPGYVSWRNGARGSWFIQAIVFVFRQYSNAHDLVSMMTEVNRLVQVKFESSSGGHKMTPSQTTHLARKFYFPARRQL